MDWQIYDGWDERCRTLAMFQALCDLSAGSPNFPGLDLRSLALSVLSFVLGAMLDARLCNEQDVEIHLTGVLATGRRGVNGSPTSAGALRSYLLERLQNHGRAFTDTFADLRPTGADKPLEFRFHLLESHFAPGGDDRTIYLRLSPDGLDLLFKTRELHKELGISIAQLLFRQQITRGIFDGALNTLRDLRLEVEQRKEAFRQLDRQIYRAVESVSASRIREAWTGTLELTRREQQTFGEMRQLISETRERLEAAVRTDSETPAIHKLWRIDRDLSQVISDHSEIIKLAADTARNHREAIERAIGRSMAVSVDLETEVLDQVTAGAAPPVALVPWLMPLFRPQPPRLFNPLRAFEPQYLTMVERTTGGEELTVSDPTFVEREAARQRQVVRQELNIYRAYLGMLLNPLAEMNEVTLTGALRRVDADARASALADSRFEYLLLYLHREPFVRFSDWRQIETAALVEMSPPLAALRELIEEDPPWTRSCVGFRLVAPPDPDDILIRADGTSLTNLRIERMGDDE